MTGQVHVHRIPTDSNTIDHGITRLLVKFIDSFLTVLHESTMCLVHRSNLEGITNITEERLQEKQLLIVANVLLMRNLN